MAKKHKKDEPFALAWSKIKGKDVTFVSVARTGKIGIRRHL